MNAHNAGFDPYECWLGIPPDRRPPTHYDLLGIEIYESDKAKIEQAALRRIGKIRQYQLGPHSDLSQDILAKLARARLVLIDPDRRAAYDSVLRETPPYPPSVAAPPAPADDRVEPEGEAGEAGPERFEALDLEIRADRPSLRGDRKPGGILLPRWQARVVRAAVFLLVNAAIFGGFLRWTAAGRQILRDRLARRDPLAVAIASPEPAPTRPPDKAAEVPPPAAPRPTRPPNPVRTAKAPEAVPAEERKPPATVPPSRPTPIAAKEDAPDEEPEPFAMPGEAEVVPRQMTDAEKMVKAIEDRAAEKAAVAPPKGARKAIAKKTTKARAQPAEPPVPDVPGYLESKKKAEDLLIADFDAVHETLKKRRNGAAKTAAIDALLFEKRRFQEDKFSLPWSPNMRGSLVRYLNRLDSAQMRLRASYTAALNFHTQRNNTAASGQLQSELNKLLDLRIMDIWECQRVDNEFTWRWHFYSNKYVNAPIGPSTWDFLQGELVIHNLERGAPAGGARERCIVADDGMSFIVRGPQGEIIYTAKLLVPGF